MGSGLRDNDVEVVHVDAQDRVWIGTGSAGLAMLDPQRRVFRHWDRRSHPVMGSNRVWSILSAPDGALWFGTDKGVTRYDGKQWSSIGKAQGVLEDHVYAVAVAANGDVWAGTKRGVTRIRQ